MTKTRSDYDQESLRRRQQVLLLPIVTLRHAGQLTFLRTGSEWERTPQAAGASLPLDVAFIDGPALTVTRSRQRYDRQGPGRVRYVDLGLSRGFEADLVVDDAGLVLRYEHLFERVAPPA